MKKNKILYIITKSYFGGAQRYVFDMAIELRKKGYGTLVALGGEGLLKTKLELNNIPTFSIKGLGRDVSLFNEFKVFYQLLKLFRKEKPDVIHLNSSKIGALGALAGRIHNLSTFFSQDHKTPKIIFTSHGWAFNENRSLVSRFIIRIIYIFTILFSHKTIAVSEKIKEQIGNFPFIQKKIVVIKNSISKIDFLPKEIARAKILENAENLNTENKKWIGTIGELHSIKGQKFFLEALAELNKNKPEYFGVIVGEGEERKVLEQSIKNLGLENSVILTGYQEDACKLLKAFDIFVFPSLSEALGYVLLEAGLAQIPVIATNVGGIPEIIENNKTGFLVNPKNPHDIKEAVRKIEHSPEEALKMARSLQKKVTEGFSLEKMVVHTLDVYSS